MKRGSQILYIILIILSSGSIVLSIESLTNNLLAAVHLGAGAMYAFLAFAILHKSLLQTKKQDTEEQDEEEAS